MKQGKLGELGGRASQGGFGEEGVGFKPTTPTVHVDALHGNLERVLAEVSKRVHAEVGNLDDLMFDVQEVGPRSRSHIHEAVALMMEAVQALDKAQAVLPRTLESGLVVLGGPMARA